jgi:ubiquinone/menaquinone biosynthesis C-methylase UbiE
MIMVKETEWWHEFFISFRPVFDNISTRHTNSQVRYLIEKLGLQPGHRFLDCPCGIGRIALALAKKGVNVTGVDIIPDYLDEIARKARRRKIDIELIHSDMRRVKFNSRFDAAANIWTSLGYFANERDDRLVLRRMHDALKPRGRFALYVINRDWVMANFQERDWFAAGDFMVLGNRSFDYRNSRMGEVWTFINQGQTKSHSVSLRLYSYHELARLFESVGFVDVQGFGSINDDPITTDKRGMWIIGTKPR